ncbi:MAG TPA: histidinol dehydrogenase [Gemmatimonadaceae bacterium]|nr:histidinol dehydrogenase [Gemmatimonadaceae bacterium]
MSLATTAAARDALFAVRGTVSDLDARARAILFDRGFSADPLVQDRVTEILLRVRRDGDSALRSLARELDGVDLDELEVSRGACTRALEKLDPVVRRAMERAADNIARVHGANPASASEIESESGVVVGRRPDPLLRTGVYAPGGRAAYPSSVLMGAIPARIAGVREIILCSPPTRDSGSPSSVVLAAAAIAGVDRVFAVGGAGAIAAMAYGTDTIPRVDRIVGPGNAYVAEAKLQVARVVGTDAPAGPSELLVIVDEGGDPEFVAREMLAQAEHDRDACVVCVTVGSEVAPRVEQHLRLLLKLQPRASIIEAALATRGGLLEVSSADAALRFAEAYAPEHLLLAVGGPEVLLPRVRNAGSIFLGPAASVSFGDYMTGANHVLPTGALARSYSGLSTEDFIRWTTYQRVSPAAAGRLAADVAAFAESEGLTAHADAARSWRAAPRPNEVMT